MTIKTLIRAFLKTLAGFVVLILVLETGLFIFSPAATRYIFNDQLKERGLSLSDDSSVRYNPFLSRLSIQDFNLIREGSNPLKIKSGRIEVDLRKSLFGNHFIRKFEMSGLDITISNINGELVIAGIDLSKNDAATASRSQPDEVNASSSASDMPSSIIERKSLIFPELAIRDSKITYIDDEKIDELYIHSLKILEGDIHQQHQSLKVELEAGFQDAKITLNTHINFSVDSRISTSELQIEGLNLSFTQDYLPEDMKIESGLLDLHVNPRFKIDGDTIEVFVAGLEMGLKEFAFEQNNLNVAINKRMLLEVKDLLFVDNSISIDSIVLESIQAAIMLSKETELEKADFEEVPGEPKEIVAEPPTEDKENTFKFSLEKFNLRGENEVSFVDERVNPVYERLFHIEKAEILNVDNQKKNNSDFQFVGNSIDYAKFDLSGYVGLFSEETNLKITGNFNELSLPALSSYIKGAIGFEFESGQLDTELDVIIEDSIINGEVGLHLRGLEMSVADNDLKSNLEVQTAVPLNVALGMLKDKQGNIKLDIPLSGSTSDPSFGMQSFFLLVTKKAVMSSAKSYLLQTFVPYASVVSVAMSVTDQILKIRFEDLVYAPKQVDITEDQQEYVKQFIALMKEKEKAQVKVCSFATIADNPDSIEARQEIAEVRAENFKKFVVQEGGIEPSRLILCSPNSDDSEGAVPRIEINI